MLNLLWAFIITGSNFKLHLLSGFLVKYAVSDLTGVLKIVGAVLIDINSHLPMFILRPEALDSGIQRRSSVLSLMLGI